jgi:excisionase family DNA binding protein
MNPVSHVPITANIADFCKITGIGRSTTYELLATGALDSLKIGRRRLIIIDSYRRLIERQQNGIPDAQSEQRKPNNDRTADHTER